MLRFMMIGCLGFLVLCAGGGWYAWQWWQVEGKARAVEEVRRVANTSVDESSLPAADKKKIRVRVDRAVEDFKSGKLSMEDFGRLVQDVAASPALRAAAVYGALAEHVEAGSTTFTDEKKRAEALRTLQRFLRGIVENKVDAKTVDDATAGLTETDAQGEVRAREKVSAKDVESALGRMKKAADDAKVPDEAYQVDFVAEFTKIFDRALEKKKTP